MAPGLPSGYSSGTGQSMRSCGRYGISRCRKRIGNRKFSLILKSRAEDRSGRQAEDADGSYGGWACKKSDALMRRLAYLCSCRLHFFWPNDRRYIRAGRSHSPAQALTFRAEPALNHPICCSLYVCAASKLSFVPSLWCSVTVMRLPGANERRPVTEMRSSSRMRS